MSFVKECLTVELNDKLGVGTVDDRLRDQLHCYGVSLFFLPFSSFFWELNIQENDKSIVISLGTKDLCLVTSLSTKMRLLYCRASISPLHRCQPLYCVPMEK